MKNNIKALTGAEAVAEAMKQINPDVVAAYPITPQTPVVETFAKFVINSLTRHRRGDWGNITDEDKQENELSLKEGYRILSAYEARGLPKIWIITEADRSATTILFPDEY